MAYQNFQTYNGSLYGTPQYKGIEYDWEVPDNLVVSSPGGVSTTHHHYTKGMYGNGASSWDVYGGEAKRYPYAEHGGLYNVGNNAPEKMHEYSMKPFDMMYTQNQSSAQIDNFTNLDKTTPIEYISPPDTNDSKELTPLTQTVKVPNPWFVFVVVLFAYMAISFWGGAGQSFLYTKFNKGIEPGYIWLGIYAIIFTGLTFFLTNIVGIPLISLELGQV